MIVPRVEPLIVRMGPAPALQLSHLVLDFNGTLARDGELLPGVQRRLVRLARRLQVHVLTADTFGSAMVALRDLPLSVHTVETGSEKRLFVTVRRRVVAVGNGQNDIPMMRSASLGIAVLGPEGLCTELLRVADVVVTSITDALDLLLEPRRLTATLRP
ncbi:MAG TPA: ATPase P [Anaeromyxobacteraceae bacterium]|nr:ATPase P [Anaeromyxobacteraceae bacterium]